MSTSQHVAEFLGSRLDPYTDFAVKAVAQNPEQQGKFERGDLEQMVTGFVQVTLDTLADRPSEARAFYLDTVIPGLVEGGSDVGAIVKTVTGWIVLVTDDFQRHYANEDKDAAVELLSDVLSTWNADLARAAVHAQAELASKA